MTVALKDWPKAARKSKFKFKYHDRKLIGAMLETLGETAFIETFEADKITINALKALMKARH